MPDKTQMTDKCEPAKDARPWEWWHWIFNPESGEKILDHWDTRQWRKQGSAVGWQYVRPATVSEVEADHGR